MRTSTPLQLYDTTLRDGTQREGLSLSVDDKVKIARALDRLGVARIEGGWPGSNPKDAEFFRRLRDFPLEQAQVAAFGSTRRAGLLCEDDPNIQALMDADTPVVTLVGKTSTLHVERVLETTRPENLRMIHDSVAWFKQLGREVVYDAEHFFDGWRLDPGYALATLHAAVDGGRGLHRAVRYQRRRAARRGLRTSPRPPGAAGYAARHPPPQRRGARRGQWAGGGAGRLRAGAGHHQRLRRALREPRSRPPHCDPPAQARIPRAAGREPVTAHRSGTLRGRSRRPAPRSARALRGPQRFRAQGRDPRRGDREGPRELPARRSGRGRQRRRGSW